MMYSLLTMKNANGDSMTRWNILIDLINTNGYKKIAEIGVFRGKTTRKVLEACDIGRYLAVDPITYKSLSRYLAKNWKVQYVALTSKEVAEELADNYFDLVFLDALHDYDHVIEDIELWQPKIREGGILCGDDYNQAHCEGIKQAVDEVFGDRVELRAIGRKGVKIWVVRI